MLTQSSFTGSWQRGNTYTTRVQHPIRPPQEHHILCLRVYHHKITLGPDVVVFLEVGTEIPFAAVVIPEVDRHVGERCGSDKLARCAVFDGRAGDAFPTFN